MPNNIANVTIPAPVIQLNNKYFIVDGQYSPVTMNVPCGVNAELDYFQWWMIPVKNEGIMTILQAVPAEGENIDQPTPDSISVIRIRDKYKPHYTWWVICTLEQYYDACATCCGDEPVPIPDPTLPIIVPCQLICDSTNEDGDFISIFGIPSLSEGQTYLGYAQFNNQSLPDITGTDLDDLVSNMNTNWGSGSSPSTGLVFTDSTSEDETIILTATGGETEDVLCVLVLTTSD